MLKVISWNQYMIGMIYCLLAYYCVVLFVYYRINLKRLLSKIHLPNANNNLNESEWQDTLTGKKSNDLDEASGGTDQYLYRQAKELGDELIEIFSKIYVKKELIWALQSKLNEFKELKDTAYQYAINNYIIQQCEEKGPIHLSAEELGIIWNK